MTSYKKLKRINISKDILYDRRPLLAECYSSWILAKIVDKIATPSILLKRVAFDFPRDLGHVQHEVESAELRVEHLWDGKITFRYASPEEVLEHLLKSGAGTAFYDAVDPTRRESLEQEFLQRLAGRHQGGPEYHVVHDYISCVAEKP